MGWFAVWTVLLIGVLGAYCEKCVFHEGALLAPSEVRACFQEVKFEEWVRDMTINAVEYYAKANAFTAFYKKGPNSDTNIDIFKELQRLRKARFTYDWEFQEAMILLCQQTNDGHFNYVPPVAYQFFTVLRPFDLQIRLNRGSIEVFVGNELYLNQLGSYSIITGLDVNSISSLQITKINGKGVLAYLEELLVAVGSFNDKSARFNFLVSSQFLVSSLLNSPLPRQDVERYTIRDTSGKEFTVDLPLLVSVQTQFSGSGDFNSQVLSAPLHNTTINVETPVTFQRKLLQRLLSPSVFHSKFKRELHFSLSIPGEFSYFEAVHQQKLYAVMKVETFSPDDLDAYIQTLLASFHHASESKPELLLLDVSGNGGGRVFLPYLLAFLLTGLPNSELADPWVSIRSPANTILWRTISLFSAMYDPKTGLVDDDWYSTTVRQRINSVTLEYTKKYAFIVDPDFKPNFAVQLGLDETYIDGLVAPFKKLVILTDGNCGSACSIFTTKLLDKGLASAISYGGLPGQPLDTSYFAANVHSSQELTEQFDVNLRVFPIFNNSAYMRFSPRIMFTSFDEKDMLPRQYKRYEANQRINDLWPSTHPAQQWILYSKALDLLNF